MPSTPRDQPGPHPQNQRKRRELAGPRRALTGLLAVTAVLAVAAGLALIARPDGSLIRLSPEMLVGSPFNSFRGTGVILVVVVGVSQAFAAFLLAGHYVRARVVALVAGLVVAAWGVAQMAMLDQLTWLQIALFGVGALETFLVAGCSPRAHSGRKRRWQ